MFLFSPLEYWDFVIILIRRCLDVSHGTYEAAVRIKSKRLQKRSIRDSTTALVTLRVSRNLAQSGLEPYTKPAKPLLSFGHNFPNSPQKLAQFHQTATFPKPWAWESARRSWSARPDNLDVNSTYATTCE